MDAGIMASGIVISGVGTALFIYGKKQANLPALMGGMALFVVPVVCTSLLVLWLVSAATVGGVWFLGRGE